LKENHLRTLRCKKKKGVSREDRVHKLSYRKDIYQQREEEKEKKKERKKRKPGSEKEHEKDSRKHPFLEESIFHQEGKSARDKWLTLRRKELE